MDPNNELLVIQQTDVDAKTAKRSAAALGYLNDPFISLFVRSGDRKPPIINRGTYVRTRAIDKLVEAFLESPSETSKQIVSLGAGTDTRFFNMKTRFGSASTFRYHEFDFQKVTSDKAKVISQTPQLRAMIHSEPSVVEIDVESGSIKSPTYCLHPMDIRQLPQASTLPSYLDPNLPTLFISECCLIYMDLDRATEIIRWIVETFQDSGVGLIIYEPIGGNDAFGKVMIRNLATRGINLKTLSAYATLQQQETRLKDCGFVDGQGTIDINSAHDQWMGQDELHRIAKLEMLDEMEEWQLLAKHYCIVWGWTDVGIEAGSTDSAFQLWRNIKNTHA